MRALVLLALLSTACAVTVPVLADDPVNDICWSESVPGYVDVLGGPVASVVVTYCGVDDPVDPNQIVVAAYDSDGKFLAQYSYKAYGEDHALHESRGSLFAFAAQEDLGEWTLPYDIAIWEDPDPLAACTSSDPGLACNDAAKTKCQSLGGGGGVQAPYLVSYVEGAEVVGCRFKCTNQSGWHYANCEIQSPPAAPQPAPTCPCEGQPACACGG